MLLPAMQGSCPQASAAGFCYTLLGDGLLVIRTLLMLSAFVGLATAGEEVVTVKHVGVLKNTGDVLLVDIGNQPLSRSLKIELSVQNATGVDIEAKVMPNCSCTKLTTDTIKVKNGEAMEFSFDADIPGGEKEISAYLACQDAATGIVFKVAMKGRAVGPVSASEEKLRVPCGNEMKTELSVLPNFGDVSVEDVRCLSSDIATVSAVNSGRIELVILAQEPDVLERQLELAVDYLDITKQVRKTVVLAVPVTYEGAVRVSPSVVSLRDVGSGLGAMIVIAGFESADDAEKAQVVLCSGLDRVVGELTKVEMTKNQLCVMRVTFADESARRLIDGNTEGARLEVALRDGVRRDVRVRYVAN